MLVNRRGSTALVTPQTWMLLGRFKRLRERELSEHTLNAFCILGAGAFSSLTGVVVKACLTIQTLELPPAEHEVAGIDAAGGTGIGAKASVLSNGPVQFLKQNSLLKRTDSTMVLTDEEEGQLLSVVASGLGGITTGDSPRYRRSFWELPVIGGSWVRQQSTVVETELYGGRDLLLRWDDEAKRSFGTIAGRGAWGRAGIAVQTMGQLPVTLYSGEPFENVAAVIVPDDPALLPALWAYCSSAEFADSVRAINQSISVTCNTMVKVPFDPGRWRAIANELFPAGLPTPHSNDPTQWLFKGHVSTSTEPLLTAVGRLIGFSWPDQVPDALDAFADDDGIVCLPAIAGENSAGERLRSILAAACASEWSTARLDGLLENSGGGPGGLDSWLRDEFFKRHTRVFQNRPSIWHIWDGRADGFSALVNYHRFDRRMLEKLTYTTLGWWIQKQKDDASNDVPGAAARLAAAGLLKSKLELVLEGEPPYDIYVRWKSLADQSVGWDPDLDDGVRMNIRPFVEAGILRTKFTINWNKDRGTNPDGSERLNDLHYTNAQKHQARGGTT